MDINVFKDTNELANAFCEELLRLTKLSKQFNIALSGGSTPKIIFKELSKNYKDKFEWNEIHFYWGDERCVPPDDVESNFGMTKKYLLDHINIPAENVHRIKGEAEPETEANRYAEVLMQNVNIKSGLPCFDLVMLGLGEDGHIASNFPNQLELLQSEKICEVAIHPATGQKRITLTSKVINNSKAVIYLVTSESKSVILKKVLKENNRDLPAAFIHPDHGSLKYFVDEAAARLL